MSKDQYLCSGTRFKLSIDDDGKVACFWNKQELDGRWIALVAAEDDRHLAAQPDCRTCDWYVQTDWDGILGCGLDHCTNGDKYIEAPRVVLWRTE